MKRKIKINNRGCITIPARMRAAVGLQADDELIIEDTGRGLLLRPAFSVPIEIYSERRIKEFSREDAAVGDIIDAADAGK